MPGARRAARSAPRTGPSSARAFWPRLYLGRLPAVVPERFVAVTDRLAEAMFDRVGNERMTFRGVPGDAVEHRAQRRTGVDALAQQRGVHRELDHDELVDG